MKILKGLAIFAAVVDAVLLVWLLVRAGVL
ncbi:MAG: hypothetical protein BWY35_01011 [Firmicutes bacterium ADurb.Bin248]|nr:MAG: hypothetical protein BWY35_01011 [Firmicutes bacterium ADurb.Bin248]